MSVTSTIHTVVMRLQGHCLTLIQQETHVQQLIADLMITIGMVRDVDGVPNLGMNIHVIRGDFSVWYAEITTFIENLGHLEMKTLASLDSHNRGKS